MLDEIFPPLEITLLNTVLSFLQLYILYNNTLVCCIVVTQSAPTAPSPGHRREPSPEY